MKNDDEDNMFGKLQVTCPVSLNKVNENIARLNALFTIFFVILSLISNSPFFVLFLAADFAIRAFTFNGKSPIKVVSKKIGKLIHVKQKLTDASPKRFAAGLGYVFSLIIGIFQLLHLTAAAYYPAAIILSCAFLESAFSFCFGCITYSYFVLPFRKSLNHKEAEA